MKRNKLIVFSLVLAAMLLLPMNSTAQYDGNGLGIQPWFESGMLGRENEFEYQYDENQFGIQPWFGTSLLGRQDAPEESYYLNLINQLLGSDSEGGYVLYNQAFDVPLGSGLFILTAAGAGYALKKRKSNNKTVSR